MAKNKRRRRSPSPRVEVSLDTLSEGMRAHVRALELNSVDAYLAWCREHGFVQRLSKTWCEREREELHHKRVQADVHVKAAARVRNPVHIVRRLLAGERLDVPDAYRELARELRVGSAYGDRSVERRRFLAELVSRLTVVAPRLLAADSEALPLLSAMADHWQAAERSPVDWRPGTRNERRSLLSLVRHVFARYPVPGCLERSWFDADDAARHHRRIYLHVAQGHNLRTADLPIPYTKKMAHLFPEAPDDFTVTEALRYGQVRGLGGVPELARSVAATRLGRGFEHDEFWRTVIQWFDRMGLRAVGDVTAVVDYVHEQRFGTQVLVDEHGRRIELPAPQPALTMAGRTPRTMARQIDAWHRRLGNASSRNAQLRWAPSGIPGYREVESVGRRPDGSREEPRVWTVRELCSGEELRLESRTMQHCVFSYAGFCSRGTTRIFTMRIEHQGKVQTVLTIEVRSHAIVQARGRRNAEPSKRARAVMERWARGAELQIRSYV